MYFFLKFAKREKMKNKILLTSVVASILATTAFATNGSELIGYGAKSRGMGGLGIATFTGTDAILKNPAILTYNTGNQLNIGNSVMFSMPEQTRANGTSYDYSTIGYTLPNIGYIHNLNDNLVVGIDLAATGGGAIDYDTDAALGPLSGLSKKMGIIDIAPAIAYKYNNFSIGLSLIYTMVIIDIENDAASSDYDISTDTGFLLGVSYQLDQLTLAFSYKSERDYDTTDATFGQKKGTMPSHRGFGIGYTTKGTHVGLEVQNIGWDSSSNGEYSNQVTIAFGASQEVNEELTLRAGLNYADNSPVPDNIVDTTLSTQPFHVTTHITTGFSYNITKDIALDAAATYALPATRTSDTSGTSYETSQMVLSLGATIKF
jgi:long-chain fatty acid transport protein